jgi:FkbM family methyltransferase
MKARELLFLLGRQPEPRTYGHVIRAFDLAQDGRVEYAQWLHPGESDKVISQGAVDELRRFIRPGEVAIDIGAHTGDSTIPIALACGVRGCVLALEPNPYVFGVLQQNAARNPGKTNIVPLMVAATPEDRAYEFGYSDEGFCNGGFFQGLARWRRGHVFTLEVQGRNLPSLLETSYPHLIPRLRYIKIDAEGQDFQILTGLSAIVRERRPHLRIEVFKHLRAADRAGLFRFLAGLGYSLHRIAEDACYRGDAIRAAGDMTKWRHFDIFADPGDAARG